MTQSLTSGKTLAAATRPGLARRSWHAVRAAIADINYAAERVADPRIAG